MRKPLALFSGRPSHAWARRGFSLPELLIVLFVVGLLAAMAVPAGTKFLRRSRDLSAVSSLSRALTEARLQSVKRGYNVCVKIDKGAAVSGNPAFSNRVVLTSWEDRNPDFKYGTYPDPNNPGTNLPEVWLHRPENVSVNATNPGPIIIESAVHLGKPGGTDDDLTTNVRFNQYRGDGSITGVVVFTPTGGLVPAEGTNCAAPDPLTLSDGRGIYLEDSAKKNFFRITIPSNLNARNITQMFIDPVGTDTRNGYYATDWRWK